MVSIRCIQQVGFLTNLYFLCIHELQAYHATGDGDGDGDGNGGCTGKEVDAVRSTIIL
jgi:hypothetical protein